MHVGLVVYLSGVTIQTRLGHTQCNSIVALFVCVCVSDHCIIDNMIFVARVNMPYSYVHCGISDGWLITGHVSLVRQDLIACPSETHDGIT